jgi:hypothetical protein
MRINWPFVVAVLAIPSIAVGMYYGFVYIAVSIISRTDVTTVMLTH